MILHIDSSSKDLSKEIREQVRRDQQKEALLAAEAESFRGTSRIKAHAGEREEKKRRDRSRARLAKASRRRNRK